MNLKSPKFLIAIGIAILAGVLAQRGINNINTDYKAGIASEAAKASLDTVSVVPDSEVVPEGVCPACKGQGRVGDGTVFVPCVFCGGDGRIDDNNNFDDDTGYLPETPALPADETDEIDPANLVPRNNCNNGRCQQAPLQRFFRMFR